MTDKIEQIRQLLNDLEGELGETDERDFMRNFDALEVPDLIRTVVDLLQPMLLPYESAIYWFLFRHSILANGQQFLRASVRGLAQGVITSASGQSESLSYGAVKKALQGLEEKGAIQKAGDTDREGTLYKVLLPEEIPQCQELMKAASTRDESEIDVARELDYYNVPENRLKVFERDDYQCRYCGKQLTRFTATLDHIQPVSEGGDNSIGNLTTACLHCNSRRGARPVMEAIIAQGKPQQC